MDTLRTARPIARVLAAFGLVLVLAASGALSDPASVLASPRFGQGRGGLRLLEMANTFGSVVPLQPLVAALDGNSAISTGSDGRLTVLLLGADSRTGGVGRTDAIIIVSIKNGTKTINAASIPRDTGRVPNPFQGGYYTGKVNSLVKRLRKGTTVDEGLRKFEIVIERWLRIEIDYHALVGFDGFTNLVDEVDPITLDITKEIRDIKHIDSPGEMQGVYFPQRNNYELDAWPRCNGLWRTQSNPIPPAYWCARALPYARSRKGAGNSDYARSARQQRLVEGAVRAVISRGSGTALDSLFATARTERNAARLWTNIPLGSAADALDLYNRLNGATLVNSVVFKPTTYAQRISGTRAYELKLKAVRAWTATYMK